MACCRSLFSLEIECLPYKEGRRNTAIIGIYAILICEIGVVKPTIHFIYVVATYAMISKKRNCYMQQYLLYAKLSHILKCNRYKKKLLGINSFLLTLTIVLHVFYIIFWPSMGHSYYKCMMVIAEHLIKRMVVDLCYFGQRLGFTLRESAITKPRHEHLYTKRCCAVNQASMWTRIYVTGHNFTLTGDWKR